MAKNKLFRILLKLIFLFSITLFINHSQKLNAQSGRSISDEGVIVLTEANFDSLINFQGVALVDFWAKWCGPCLMQAPIIEEIKKEIGNNALVGKLDVDRNKNISRRYSIRGIPALLIFKNGVVVEKLIGYQQKSRLMASLKKYIQ